MTNKTYKPFVMMLLGLTFVAGPAYFFLSDKLRPPVRLEFKAEDYRIAEALLQIQPDVYIAIEVMEGRSVTDFWTCLCVIDNAKFEGDSNWIKSNLPKDFNFWGKRELFAYSDKIFVRQIELSDVYLIKLHISEDFSLAVVSGNWSKVSQLVK